MEITRKELEKYFNSYDFKNVTLNKLKKLMKKFDLTFDLKKNVEDEIFLKDIEGCYHSNGTWREYTCDQNREYLRVKILAWNLNMSVAYREFDGVMKVWNDKWTINQKELINAIISVYQRREKGTY